VTAATVTEARPGRGTVGVADRTEHHVETASSARTAVAFALWATLVLVSAVWGNALLHARVHMQIGAPPLTGTPDWRPGIPLATAALTGILAAYGLPPLVDRVSWRKLLVVAPVAALVWTLTINAVDGWTAFTRPVHTEYAATAATITAPQQFLHVLLTHPSQFNIHTRGHPPGLPLLLWGLRALGLTSTTGVAALYVLVGVAAVPAVLVTVADVAGRRAARGAAPFLILVPGAVWMATSGDAFFTGVSAWAVALTVVATGRHDRWGDVLALLGGALFGVTAFLSYGLVLLALITLAVAVARRRIRPLLLAGLGAAPLFAGFAAAGFWWLDGWAVTRHAYAAGVASRRPYDYFLLADLGAFLLAVGPAAAVALAWLRDRRLAVVTGAALAAIAIADVSGMSKAEVERIWLPFAPWVLVATTALAIARRRRTARLLLVAQVLTAVGIQAFVRSPW
jgi:methylthioxylose transferase